MRNALRDFASMTSVLFCFACSSSADDVSGDGSGGAGGAGGAGGEHADNECGIDSGYPGDELCILPPDPTEGIQLWVGPTDYDDPDAVAPYLLPPGEEDVVCYNTSPVSAGAFYFLEQRNRMRSGSHHMLIDLKTADGREPGRVTDPAECEGFDGRVGSIPGSQTPINDFLTENFAPEDQGLGRWFPEGVVATFQLHYVNTTQETVMREAWANLTFKDEDEVTARLNMIFLVGDFAVAVEPGARELTQLSYTPALPEPTRIFDMYGHSHAHSERFSTWRNRGTPDEELLYESYDWSEPDVLRFNTVIDNPAPDRAALIDGGVSGLLHLDPGDTIDFECEVNNTSDQVLNFANEAYTAEMCLLRGSYVGEPGLMSGFCSSGSCISLGGLGSAAP